MNNSIANKPHAMERNDEVHRQALLAQARARTHEEGATFHPDKYGSAEEMLTAAEALLVKWWEGAPDGD